MDVLNQNGFNWEILRHTKYPWHSKYATYQEKYYLLKSLYMDTAHLNLMLQGLNSEDKLHTFD